MFVLHAVGGRQLALLAYFMAAACIQLRLLANLLDGMLAVEGGLGSPAGELYNEIPDRLSDVLILAAAGYAIPAIAWAPELGWGVAVLAVLTAYVRAFGGSLGQPQDFCGPMGKPQRMAVMTAGCIGAAIGGRDIVLLAR